MQTLKIIDLSVHQPKVVYNKLGASGVSAIIARVGGSHFTDGKRGVDAQYQAHSKGARDNELKLGHYWFNGLGKTVDDAVYFVSKLKEFKPGDPLVLDIENFQSYSSSKNKWVSHSAWTPEQAYQFLKQVKSMVPNANLFVYMSDSLAAKGTYQKVLKPLAVRLWVARYGVNNGRQNSKPVTKSYAIWQYTSKAQLAAVPKVSGQSGYVDLNIADSNVWTNPVTKTNTNTNTQLHKTNKLHFKTTKALKGYSKPSTGSEVRYTRDKGYDLYGYDLGNGWMETQYKTFYQTKNLERVFPAWRPAQTSKWFQVKHPDNVKATKIGNTKHRCLETTRTVLGIGVKYSNARLARLAAIKAGDAHKTTPPKGIAYVVFCTTDGVYDHVYYVDSKGYAWSTGFNKTIKNIGKGWKAYGKHDRRAKNFYWSTSLNGVQVIKKLSVNNAWTVKKTYAKPKIVNIVEDTHYYKNPLASKSNQGPVRKKGSKKLKVIAAGVNQYGTVYLQTNKNTFYIAERTDWSNN